VLLIIRIVILVWMSVCLRVVAICASAKAGDGDDATLAPDAVLWPRRRHVRRRAPALS